MRTRPVDLDRLQHWLRALITFGGANPQRDALPDDVRAGSGELRGGSSVTVAFVGSRLLIIAIILLSRVVVIPGPLWEKGGLLTTLTTGDADAYIAMAQHGDWLGQTSPTDEIGFFPLFPVMLAVTRFFLRSYEIAGVLVANVALLAAGHLLFKLVCRETGNYRVARTAVAFLMLNPVTFFFSAALPESTAIMLAIGALLAARQERWDLAAIAGLCLSATISTGVIIIVPLLLEFVAQHRENGAATRVLRDRRAFLLLLPFAFPALVLALGYARDGDPFALLPFTADWERRFDILIERSVTFGTYRVFYHWLFWAAVAAAAATWLGGMLFKIRVSYLAYAALFIALCVWTHDREAVRTLALAFPLYIAAALAAHRFGWLYELLLTGSTVLLLLCTVAAANGFWLT